MPTYNLVAYQLPFGWLDSNGSNFTYSTGSMPSDVLTVTETDGTADDWFDDYSPSSHSGDSATQIAQADVFGFSIDGKAVQVAARMRLTGSDGSDFQVYVVTTDSGGAGLEDDDYIFVSEQPLLDGVTYTKATVSGFFGSDGEVLYADLVQVPPDGYVDGTAGDDFIGTVYTGDPDGDMVDNGDALLPGHTGDDDYIRAGAGDDVVLAGAGDDTVEGGAGNDVISGGAGDDTIRGDAGNDLIDGGTGHDILIGGAGDDTFTYQDGDGMDIITDFSTGESGPTDDGDQSNNDFVDLAAFYNASTVAAVNGSDADPGNDFANAIGMMRADQADGMLDGIIDGVDYTPQIGNIDLTLQNGGSAVDGDTLTHDNTNVVCFVRGTRIATQNGEVAIEDLTIGDKVMTVDRGYQPIRWIGSTTVPATGKRAPIVFAKGAIGNPRELRVSPSHRLLLTGWQAGMLFGENEVLVAAKHLVNDTSIQRRVGGTVDYFHMLFDRHEIIFSEGARTESFHPGQQGWGALAEQTRSEILDLLPQLDPENFAAYGQSARLSLKAFEGELVRDIGGFIQDVAALERQS